MRNQILFTLLTLLFFSSCLPIGGNDETITKNSGQASSGVQGPSPQGGVKVGGNETDLVNDISDEDETSEVFSNNQNAHSNLLENSEYQASLARIETLGPSGADQIPKSCEVAVRWMEWPSCANLADHKYCLDAKAYHVLFCQEDSDIKVDDIIDSSPPANSPPPAVVGYPTPAPGIAPETVNSPVALSQILMQQDWGASREGTGDLHYEDDGMQPLDVNFAVTFNSYDSDHPVKKEWIVTNQSEHPILSDANNGKAIFHYIERGTHSSSSRNDVLHSRSELAYGHYPSPYGTYGSSRFRNRYTRLRKWFVVNQRIAVGPNHHKSRDGNGKDYYDSILETKQDGGPDGYSYRGRDATFRLRLAGDYMNVVLNYHKDANKEHRDSGRVGVRDGIRIPGNFYDGKFHLWTSELYFSPDENGVVRIYYDGELVYERKGQNCYWDTKNGSNNKDDIDLDFGPYFKSGLYSGYFRNRLNHGSGKEYSEIYVDFISVGTK